MNHQVLIALGSNLEPRVDHLTHAISAIKKAENIELIATSPIYETVPKGYADQGDFLNMVIKIQTTLSPDVLLDFCQSIEVMENRVRTIKNGPRTIDVDILLIDQVQINQADLQIPHPRMHERAFVLFPASDIAADWLVPGLGANIDTLKEDLADAEKADVRIANLQLEN